MTRDPDDGRQRLRLFSSPLTFVAFTWCDCSPRNSIKIRLFTEWYIRVWVEEVSFTLGTAPVAAGSAVGCFNLGCGAICMRRSTGALNDLTRIFYAVGNLLSPVFLSSSRETWAYSFFCFFFFSLPTLAVMVLKPSSLLPSSVIGSTLVAQKPLPWFPRSGD